MDDDRRRKSRARPESHGASSEGKSTPVSPPKQSPRKRSPKSRPEKGAGVTDLSDLGAVGGEPAVHHRSTCSPSNYWAARHEEGHRVQQEPSCQDPLQSRLHGMSMTDRFPPKSNESSFLSSARTSSWALPTQTRDASASFKESAPRNTEELPYKQKNILRPPRVQKPSNRPVAKGRRRSVGSHQAAAGSEHPSDLLVLCCSFCRHNIDIDHLLKSPNP